MSERLTGIEAFVAAAEAGNFALAAMRLQRTRSAVAKSVARLEARLGTRLFQRSTRSQSLTEDGRAYYERCRRALAELDAADATVEAGRTTPRGRLRVTMSCSCCQYSEWIFANHRTTAAFSRSVLPM